MTISPRVSAAFAHNRAPALSNRRGGFPRAAWSVRGRPQLGAPPSPCARSASEAASRAPLSNSTRVAGMAASAAMRFCRATCLGGRKPSKKKRSVGSPATPSAASTADAPGIAVTAWPASLRRAHQLVAGIGNQRRAGVRHQRHRLAVRQPGEQLRPRLGRVMLVIGRERRRDAVALGQLARDACVLAGDAHRRRPAVRARAGVISPKFPIGVATK